MNQHSKSSLMTPLPAVSSPLDRANRAKSQTRTAPLMHAGSGVGLILALCTSTACSKSGEQVAPAASASAAGSTAPVASGARGGSPAASAAAANPSEPTAWSGSYVAKVGPVDAPAGGKNWTEDPGTAAVGRGAISLSVRGPRGDTQGEISGPLGEMRLAGAFDGKELRANILPKDPNAEGAMTGFLNLSSEGATPPAALKGTLRVSNKDARIVREASVELAKK